MIGYEMSSSLSRVYVIAKTSLVENSKHGWKNDMVANMATLFVRGVLWRSCFLGKLQTLIQETWPPENFILRLISFSSFLFPFFLF